MLSKSAEKSSPIPQRALLNTTNLLSMVIGVDPITDKRKLTVNWSRIAVIAYPTYPSSVLLLVKGTKCCFLPYLRPMMAAIASDTTKMTEKFCFISNSFLLSEGG